MARALTGALILALIWWFIALQIRRIDLIPVWYDQSITFTRSTNILNPYVVNTFLYPPWAALLFLPNSLTPLPVSTLIQTCLYFVIITLAIFKYGGGLPAVLITLTSFIAFDAVLELNIDWIVYIGLLVPAALSGPLLVIKPQLALGVWLSFSQRDLIRAVIVLLAVVLVSFLIWGAWPETMLDAIRKYTLESGAYNTFNIAPLSWMPAPLAILLGLALGAVAFRRRDPVFSIFAWLFFVPYITLYSLLMPLALAAARWPRPTLVVSIVIWLVYGGTILLALLV